MTRPGGLGRGLGALIPAGEMRSTEVSMGLLEVTVGAIVANPNQPRIHFDDEALSHLADSIKELGVLQPLLVRQLAPGSFELIAGERRLRAAKRAGLQTVPIIVRDADNATSLAQAIVENVQREDLNPLEEAVAYQQLIEDFQLTHDDVATRVGKSRTSVTNVLRLLQLSPTIQRYVRDGQLKMGHARALLGTPDRSMQEKLARRAVADELSVRVVEELVRDASARPDDSTEPEPPPKSRTPQLRTPGLLELEGLLSDHLDTRVHVSITQNRGKVVVEFANLEDLERIYRVMTEGKITD